MYVVITIYIDGTKIRVWARQLCLVTNGPLISNPTPES